MTRLRGAHILVTGGSEGIGFAVAGRAAASGARVSLIARDAGKLAAAAAAVSADCAWRSADVTDDGCLAEAIASLEAERGGVDVVLLEPVVRAGMRRTIARTHRER